MMVLFCFYIGEAEYLRIDQNEDVNLSLQIIAK